MDNLKIIESFVNNLFRNGVEPFILSKQYKYLCRENHVKHYTEYKIRAVGHVDYSDNAQLLVKMLHGLYNKSKLEFESFIFEFIKGYKDFHGPIFDLEKLVEYLNQLKISTAKIEALSYPPKPSLFVNKEGVFFAGQNYDAIKNINNILKTAKNSIIIIDGYVNEDVINILTEKNKNVQVLLLTYKVSPSLKTSILAFNKQYTGLSIRTSNKFHDRFIIIDNLEIYHLGASIKDLGSKGFMFSRIEEKEIIDSVNEYFKKEWEIAKIEI